MQIRMPTDLEPTGGVVRPDQTVAPQPQPMPTLADLGVPVRSSGNAGTSAPREQKPKR